jgi:hypothetical protein
MAIPTPEELYNNLSPGVRDNFSRQFNNFESDPDTYENPWEYIEDYAASPEEVKTPQTLIESKAKAKLTISSTSTLNPNSPRTLSAGYDAENYILTVQFRDGTLYNYYDVPLEMWEAFSAADSKGKYLKASGLDDWPDDKRGPAGSSNSSWFKSRAARASAQQKEYGGMQIGRTRK